VKPTYDAELATVVAELGSALTSSLTLDTLPARRANGLFFSIDDLIAGRPLIHEERVIDGYQGVPIEVSIVRPVAAPPVVAFLHIHGGGMVMGNRTIGAPAYVEWAHRLPAVVVSVEYRLAPEFPHPTPVEDCFAALQWLADNAGDLGFDPGHVIVAGSSAGGGLAAAVALLARDRRGPKLCGQLLGCPMLDDRNQSVSTRQFDQVAGWSRDSNLTGWRALLGDSQGGEDVSPYAAPARAADLSNLPPAYIDVGSADVLRDEDVAYASRIWAAGGLAELHVWPGAFHGFTHFAPNAKLTRHAERARWNWLERVTR
jgi:acetyl esterase/lipase